MGLFKEPDVFDSIKIHDIVIMHIAGKPGCYCRVEDIVFDKDDHCGLWWSVTFTALVFPAVKFTWSLDDNHIRFSPFSMGGVPHQLELVVPDKEVMPGTTVVIEPVVTKPTACNGIDVTRPCSRPKVVPLKPEFEKYCGYSDEEKV